MSGNSSKPSTASASGSESARSFPYRSARQPTATTAFADPSLLSSEASSRVSTESFFAASTKPHVFTTTVSASSGSLTSRNPPASSRPASSSESTSLRAQPSVTRATVVKGPGRAVVSGSAVIAISKYDGQPLVWRTCTSRGGAGSSPGVAALGSADLAVTQGDLGFPGLVEVLQVAPGTDSGDAEQRRRLRRGEVVRPVGKAAQGVLDELEGLRPEPLRQALGRSCHPEQPVHVGLVGVLAGDAGVGLLVVLQTKAQVVIGERLHQVVDDAAAQRPANGVGLPRRGDHQHVHLRRGVPQAREQVETGDVREVYVEQHQVGLETLRLGERLRTVVRHAGHREARRSLDEAGVDPRHHEVVVDDQHLDHGVACRSAGCRDGSVAVNTAPLSPSSPLLLVTTTSPPRRRQTSRTSARPKPRPPSEPLVLVEYPCRKTRSGSPTPGPVSWTRTVIASESSTTSTATRGRSSAPSAAAASRALSTRLPTTVVRSRARSPYTLPTCDSGSSCRSTPRSTARLALAISKAATVASAIREVTSSYSDVRLIRTPSTNCTTSPYSSRCSRPEIVCSWLANSWVCARSVSLVARLVPSSRSSADSSVRSRSVVTQPITVPCERIGLRLKASTLSPTSTSRSGSGCLLVSTSTSCASMSSSSTGRPTASAGSWRSCRALSLTTVIRRCGSRAITPSLTPCTSASRCSTSPAISVGSMPRVCRFTRRASSSEPPIPNRLATPRKTSRFGATSPSRLHTDGTSRPTAAMPITSPRRSYTGTSARTTRPPPASWLPVQAAPASTLRAPRRTLSPTRLGSEDTSTTRSVRARNTEGDPDTVRTDSATEASPELSKGRACWIR